MYVFGILHKVWRKLSKSSHPPKEYTTELSTHFKAANMLEIELYTELSTLSTAKEDKKEIYIRILGNECFVEKL